jgi:hypothetical protein
MKRKVGRLQRAVRRVFAANNGQPALTTDFMMAFPTRSTFVNADYFDMRRAAHRFAIPIGRSSNNGKGRPLIWLPNDELLRLVAAISEG